MYTIRKFKSEDTQNVNEIALSAFLQYQSCYSDWESFSAKISNMASLASESKLLVATSEEEKIIGAVAYVPAGKSNGFFSSEWAAIRMLVVNPNYRGIGLGRALTEACISHAIQDKFNCIALHTSPIMEVALKMYLKMGFEFVKEMPPIHGVPYNIYKKILV